MDRNQFDNDFWSYYLALESKLINTATYVEFSEDNYETFSLEFAMQLQSIGSEIDTVFKEICGFTQADRKTIAQYAPIVLEKYPQIVTQEVGLSRGGITIKPFEGWNSNNPSTSLLWWANYNYLKHCRVSNFKKANLKSALHSLAGLFILESYWFKDICDNDGGVDIPAKRSKLFWLVNWKTRYLSGEGSFMKIIEEVPYKPKDLHN